MASRPPPPLLDGAVAQPFGECERVAAQVTGLSALRLVVQARLERIGEGTGPGRFDDAQDRLRRAVRFGVAIGEQCAAHTLPVPGEEQLRDCAATVVRNQIHSADSSRRQTGETQPATVLIASVVSAEGVNPVASRLARRRTPT